jgi:hypothetical protein
MKKTWLLGGLAALMLAAPARSQDAIVQGCEKFKADIAKQKDACSEENAAAAKISCKTKDDMNAALKLFQTCGKKSVAAATSGGKTASSTTASKDGAAAKDSGATKEWKCKAVDVTDNKDIAEASAPKMMECMTALKEKVKAARCSAGAEKVEFLNQSWVINRWSKGTKLSVTCK